MSIESKSLAARRGGRLSQERPQVDRIEHGNLDRPGAYLHPRAGAPRRAGPAAGWERHGAGPAAWK